jgi:hypothetical protein
VKQVGHRKILDGQAAVGLGKLARGLLQKASADVGNAMVLSGQQASGFDPVSGTGVYSATGLDANMCSHLDRSVCCDPLQVDPIQPMSDVDAHHAVARLPLAWASRQRRDRRQDGGLGREQDPMAGAVP